METITNLNQLKNNQRLLERTFSALAPLTNWLEDTTRNQLCPFHDDSRPSARLHKDDDGIERLWCFTCNRLYTSVDLARTYGEHSDLLKMMVEELGESEVMAEATRQLHNEPEGEDWKGYYNLLMEDSADVLEYVRAAYAVKEPLDFVANVYDKSGGLQAFTRLYNHVKDIHDLKGDHHSLKRNPNYLTFLKKTGRSVRLINHIEHLEYLPHTNDYSRFFNEAWNFWMIPCDLPDGESYGYLLRTFKEKDDKFKFAQYKRAGTMPLLFGFHAFGNFEKGQPIVIVEGAKDAIRLQQYYPYVLACLTSGLSQRSTHFLSQLTSKFVLGLDNDASGKRQTTKLRKALKNLGMNVETISVTSPAKDWGDIDLVGEHYIQKQLTHSLGLLGTTL